VFRVEPSNGRRLAEWADATGDRAGRRNREERRPKGWPCNWRAEERDLAGKVEGKRQGRAGHAFPTGIVPRKAMPARAASSAMAGLERMPREQLGSLPDANAPSASDE
jgi:hypothetical protein